METITIIDGIGWKRDFIAAFKNDERVVFEKIDPAKITEEVLKLREQFKEYKCCELKCSSSYKEFVTTTDFPTSLKEYFK